MLEDLQSKIDLYQEQIDNLEKSGHFTDKEIETQSIPLKAHLSLLKDVKSLHILSITSGEAAKRMMEFIEVAEKIKVATHLKYGMTKESYEEGRDIHEMYFKNLGLLPVIKPEYQTSKPQEAK
jgi:hypothetical protein